MESQPRREAHDRAHAAYLRLDEAGKQVAQAQHFLSEQIDDPRYALATLESANQRWRELHGEYMASVREYARLAWGGSHP
jgi:hypothetical protein